MRAVQPHDASCQGPSRLFEVLQRCEWHELKGVREIRTDKLRAGSRHGAHHECGLSCAADITMISRTSISIETDFSDFTLYFLAFDHSNGADSLETKQANRTNREGVLSLVLTSPRYLMSHSHSFPQASLS